MTNSVWKTIQYFPEWDCCFQVDQTCPEWMFDWAFRRVARRTQRLVHRNVRHLLRSSPLSIVGDARHS